MSNYKIIGGEFEIMNPHNTQITPPHTHISDYSVYTYSSGRAALYNICKAEGLKGRKVFIPDYLCASIPLTVQKAGMSYEYYNLDDNLTPNMDDCETKVDKDGVILIINYFGCIDTYNVIKSVKSILPDVVIILDNVQCPFNILQPTAADYCFTSFRKAYPVTDGAYVVTKDSSLHQPTVRSKFAQYKLAASLLKENRDKGYFEDDIYLSLFQQGEDLIDGDLDTDMSDHAKMSMLELEVYRVKVLRQRNASVLLEGLESLGIKTLIPIREGITPLFIPVSIPNRDKIRKKLFEKNIFCPVHWPLEIDEQKQGKGLEISKSELSLIMDQRYTVSDMKLILDTIKENL